MDDSIIKMENLEIKARELRRKVLDLSVKTGEAHLGGSFSMIEIIISLYDVIMKKEDKFILSKGHCSYPMYLLLKERGYNPKVSTHPDIDIENGICCTTGSLGHGLPIGVGMAIARKFKRQKGKIYVLLGDGECQEGTTWESSLIASQHKLDNLIAIIDYNKIQALDRLENILSLNNLAKKFDVFGWYASEVNGHSFPELIDVLNQTYNGKPLAIIAHTIKGKGVSYMENNPEWHARKARSERVKQAYEELK